MRERKRKHGVRSLISYALAAAMMVTGIPSTMLTSAEDLSDEYLAAPVGGEELLSDGSEEIANGTAIIVDPTAVVDEAGGSDGTEDLLSDGDGSTSAAYAPINFEKVLESGLTVKVNVPEDVFQEGTTVEAADVAEEEMESLTAKIKEDLDGQLDGEIVKVLAADISFLDTEGTSILPAADVDVTFIPSDEVKAELKEKEGLALTLVYVPAEGKAAVVAEDKIVEKSVDGIAFKTVQFPRYAIVATAASEEEIAVEDAVVEEPAPVEDVAEEAEQAFSAKVEGVRKSYYTIFTAELSGATITASVPYYYVSTGTTMEVSFAATDAYESIISKANYGKEITDLKAVDISFTDRRGREISLYSVNLSIELENSGAETYVLYQPYTGWFGTELYQLRTSRSPKFTVYASTDSYVVAALKADGIDRASGETKRGRTKFGLRTGNANISVDSEKNAFNESVTMEAVTTDAESIADAVNSVLGEDVVAESIQAFDISFHSIDGGEEIEPNKSVTVTITLPLDEAVEYQLVHVNDDGEAEIIESAVFGADGVTFNAAEFSVYAIVETGDPDDPYSPARTTYEFYNADGSIYNFKDAAGRDQYTQILKDGEILEDVGIPTQGASQNAKFVGWYVWKEDGTLGEKVEVGEAKTVTENTIIKLKAKLQGIVNVFFLTAVMKDDQGQPVERSVVTVKQVEYSVGQTDPIVVDTSDVTTEAPTSEEAVVGWNSDQTAANSGIVEGQNGIITLYNDGTGKITDVMLFPAVQEAYWLYFNENDGGTGGGASYTKPQFVQVGGKPTEPAEPHRTGYEFGGWYKDADCTQPFDFDAVMTETTTVYAKWNGSSTTYTIIVKVQSTTDSAKITSNSNLAHNAKAYEFWKSYTVSNVQTGGTATVANTYKQLANEIDSSGYITYETCDNDKTIAADGSTVLYVYYQRTVMTIHWRNNYNGTDRYTWYGLYGASFAESNKTWIEPDSGYRWRTSSMLLTFMDSFKNFNPAGTSLIIYRETDTDSWYSIYFYTENLDGTWKLDHTFEFNAGTFQFAEKYDAFSLYQYSRNGSTNWQTATAGNSVSRNNQNLYIRYRRNRYNIEYHNGTQGAEGTIVRTDSMLFEAPLENHANPSVTYPVAADADHYNFIGWFADSGWKTMVTFTELDEETKNNYRNWYGVAEFVAISKMPNHNFPLYAGYALKGWDCALNPNGGEFTNSNQAGVFWLNYGEHFSSDLKQSIKRDGYIFQGWMVADVPKLDDENLDLKDVYTSDSNLRFVGDFSNWTMTEEPWEFATGIEGATALMAKWFYLSKMQVVYDANGGTNPPTDEGGYSDGAKTVAFRAPIPPDNKFFKGWDIQGTTAEEKLQPGATFEVNSDYAVDGVVTLKAVYGDYPSEEEVPVTHLTWYDNFTENPVENESFITDDDIQINKSYAIKGANTFTRDGYRFLGWARVPTNNTDGTDFNPPYTLQPKDLDEDDLFLKYENGKFYAKNETTGEMDVEVSYVAADENYPYHDMYAVWEAYYTIYHSGKDSTAEGVKVTKKADKAAIKPYKFADTNLLYGGYYVQKLNAETSVCSVPKDGKAYDGTNWEWITPGTSVEYTPEAGDIIYLKEVPTKYLAPTLFYTKDSLDDGRYRQLAALTAVDDLLYCQVGFEITVTQPFKNSDASPDSQTVYEVVTFTKKGTTTTYELSDIFKSLSRGYLGVYAFERRGIDGLIGTEIIGGTTFTYKPYFITPDGLRVYGQNGRSYTISQDVKDFSEKKALPIDEFGSPEESDITYQKKLEVKTS